MDAIDRPEAWLMHSALSIGALGVGALAVSALAIGRIAARDVRIRRLRIESLGLGQSLSLERLEGPGIVVRRSHHSVDETIARVEAILRQKGVPLFAVVDHSGEAQKAGMRMRPTKLLVFGSPKAGTPLMIASPSIALDLPLKLLVSQDDDGAVWISFNSIDDLRERHHLSAELAQGVGIASALAKAAAD